MGKGKHCSVESRKLIKKLHQEGKSQRKIAEIIGCSRKIVENAIKYKKTRNKRKKDQNIRSFKTKITAS